MSLEAIKCKIRTAEDLQTVVKTMKALAAVNIRQFEDAVKSLADITVPSPWAFKS
jgi:F-type H+-transporting ATPase subunit gamma